MNSIINTNVTIGPNQYIYDSTLLTYGYYDIKYSASSSLETYLVVSTQQGSDPSQNGVKFVTNSLSQYLQQDTINSYYVVLYNSGSTSVTLTTFTIEPSYYQLKTDTNTNPSDIPYEGSQITIAPSKTLYFTCYDCLPVIAGTGYARAFIGNSYSIDPQTVSVGVGFTKFGTPQIVKKLFVHNSSWRYVLDVSVAPSSNSPHIYVSVTCEEKRISCSVRLNIQSVSHAGMSLFNNSFAQSSWMMILLILTITFIQ